MRICFIGKYPPIEGGVSASTYWLARGLAERGHDVSVVTNAGEVEDAYRMHLVAADAPMLTPAFPASGGQVRVFPTEPVGPRMTHIPHHNPFATKLAGLATQTIRSRGCDVIVAYYFEPYGIAASLAAAWTETPWIARHAGSDLERLMLSPQLSTAYKETIKTAAAVVTRPGLGRRFVGMGIEPARVFMTASYSPPRSCFNAAAEPLAIGELPAKLAPVAADGTPVPFDTARPTIGIYGKTGVTKGSFDLLRALAILREEQRPFNFLAMTQGTSFPPFAAAVREHGLDDRTWAIPFLPNWRVPSFILTCTAVCFLERDFPIKIHGPVIAAEVFAAGGCLVVSGEIANKQGSRERMIDRGNVLVVEDPKDQHDLAAALRTVITAPDAARQIGHAGEALARDDFDAHIESWEQVLLRATGRASTARSLFERPAPEAASPDASAAVADVRGRVPWLEAVLPAETPRLLARFQAIAGASAVEDPIGDGLRFLDLLREELAAAPVGGDTRLVAECLRFQTHRWQAGRDDGDHLPPFAGVDALCGAPVASARARTLRPLRSEHVEIVDFDFDVTPLFDWSGRRNGDGATAPLATVAPEPTTVCFLRAPNLHPTELKLSAAARRLLELCDGTRTTEALLDAAADGEGGGEADARDAGLRALQTLYDRRVVIFCGAATA